MEDKKDKVIENKEKEDKYIESVINMMKNMDENSKKRIYRLTKYILNNK